MEDQLVIKQRMYKRYMGKIVQDLIPYLKERSTDLHGCNSGVVIDGDHILTITSSNQTYIKFRVDDNNIVKYVIIEPWAFDSITRSIFYPNDKKVITDYLNSYVGMSIEGLF